MLLKSKDNILNIDSESEKDEILHIQMLSDFVLRYKGEVLSGEKVRAKQVWTLLEYILVNRNKEISVEKLTDVLWKDDCVEDPVNALKNLAYRLRIILKKSLNLPRNDYIVYKHGAYVWNPEIPCSFDVDEFENACTVAQQENLDKSEVVKQYKKAINIYKGNLLPQSSYKEWVMPLEIYYQRMYMDAIEKLCSILIDLEEYKTVEELCRSAIIIDPFVEMNHVLLIKALSRNNNQKKAIEHYDAVCKLFRDELGIKPSEEISLLYQEVIDRNIAFEKDISIIKNDLKEADKLAGALYCNYEMFKMIYRLQARATLRTNSSIFIALLTIECNDYKNSGLDCDETVEKLKSIILMSLRKDDVVARYGKTQFLIMLANITRENTNMVLNRMIQKLNDSKIVNNSQIYGQIQALDSVEFIK